MADDQVTRRTFLVVVEFEDLSELKLVQHRLADAARYIDGVVRTVLVQDISGLEDGHTNKV